MSKFAFLLAFAVLLISPSVIQAADPPIVGNWDCEFISPDGEPIRAELAFKMEGGKLVGHVVVPEGENVPLIDPKYENEQVVFQVDYQGERYDITAKVSGDALEGDWRGPTDTGKMSGKRKSA